MGPGKTTIIQTIGLGTTTLFRLLGPSGSTAPEIHDLSAFIGFGPVGQARPKLFKLLILAPQPYSDSFGPVAQKLQKPMISQHSLALAQWARQDQNYSNY